MIQDRKVLMVLESGYPTEGGGGAEGQLRTLSNYLKQHGVPLEIIVPMRVGEPPEEHDSVDGLPVWRIPYPKIRKLGGVIMLARLATGLIRRRREYQVIHAHIAHNMAAVCCVVGRLLGKTVVVKITGSRELARGVLDSERIGIGTAIQRWALRRASYVQATSSEISRRLVEMGFPSERVKIIPNAVNVEKFSQSPEEARKAEPLTAVYVGRLEPVKGVDVLVSAWLKAFDVNANARLWLVGDGGEKEMLESMVRQAGMVEQIRFLGPRTDIPEILSAAHFAVLPSRYEGLSNALLEYMAAGLPVLGTRVSGTEDFIEEGSNGWLVDSESVEQLAARLQQVAHMDTDQLANMGDAANRTVVSRARIDAVVRQLADLYSIDRLVFRAVQRSNYS